ncbi:MAG: alpha/beta hydrolase [Candidatus Acidiferrum sp.]
MPSVELDQSPHAPGVSPVRIFYREFGRGRPLLFLHGGWGYEVYPFDHQIAEFAKDWRILIPDRSGYGHSTRMDGEMPLDFHKRAGAESFAFLDELGIERAVLWGHSDGAVIAAMMGMAAPERCGAVILEAFHFLRRKPGSRSFFERFTARPEDLGEQTRKLLAKNHGEANWMRVPRRNCGAWIRIADEAQRADEDLYGGHLGELGAPTLFLHGSLDPRTEPGEMESVRAALPGAAMKFIENGEHSPHSEEGASKECNEAVRSFLENVQG